MAHGDYRDHLRTKCLAPVKVQRTRKRRGDWIEVWQNGEYRWVRHGEEQAA